MNSVELPLDWSPLARHGSCSPATCSHPCLVCPTRPLTICGVLDDAELTRLAAELTTVERPPQYLVYREQAPRDQVFILGSGVVRCFKTLPDGRRQITRFFFTGDVFGLIAEDGRQVSSAQTVTRATICSFPRRVLDQFPKLHAHLLHRSWEDLARAEDQMLLLGRRTAQERIAHFLLMLAEHAAEPEQRAAIVPVPMSRTDIADYLGLTTETVSRALSQLKRDGVIRLLQRSRIALQNRDALAAMVAGSPSLIPCAAGVLA